MPLLGLMFGSRIGTIITLVIFGSTFFFGWLAWHDNQVWNKATDAFNAAQRTLLAEKEEEFKQQTTVIDDNAQRIRDAIAERERQLDRIDSDIGSSNANVGTGQASPYLKDVVKQLEKSYGSK